MHTLKFLLEREEDQRDVAMRRLQHAEDHARRAHTQADMLRSYRDEYHQRWNTQFARGGSMPVVHCYQGFMARLDDAIAQQQRQLDGALRQVAECRAALAAQQLRVASVAKLIERRQREHASGTLRREQKAADETAARLPRDTAWPTVTAALTPGA